MIARRLTGTTRSALLGLTLAAVISSGCQTVSPVAPSPRTRKVERPSADPISRHLRTERETLAPVVSRGVARSTPSPDFGIQPAGFSQPIAAARHGGTYAPVPGTLPPSAWTGQPFASGDGCPPDEAMAADGHWQPDGLYGPWPYDEYIFDGGDRDVPVKVDRDWTVRGIDHEDTIAHYDTLQGRTEVVPSNRVPIYAPRFAAVRKVSGLEFHEGHERVAGTENPTRLNSQEATRLVTTAVQPRQPVLQHNARTSVALIDRNRGIGVDNVQRPWGFDNHFLPYEDFLLIRRGQFNSAENARLAQRIQAALVWTSDQMVQVVIDGDPAVEAQGTSKVQEAVEYQMPPGKPRLRIVKVASKSEALPGEEIDFTLRFDNVGDQRIGNVTIIDSLTTRLEYVDGSAQCSLKSEFKTQENEAESTLLRWEIADPLDVGQGGIIRFKCRMR